MRGRHGPKVGVVGLDHVHGLVLAARLWQAGASIVAFHAHAARDVAAMRLLGPRARSCSVDAIVEHPEVEVVVTAAVPRDRGDIAVRALRNGKHVVADKPGVTTLDGLAEIEAALAATDRRWWVMFGERFENRAVAEACRRARQGDIGRVVSVLGLGPHRLGAPGRPDWFWEPDATGGILVDIGAHQADQLLTATGAREGRVLTAAVGNVACARHPRMQDVGHMVVEAGGAVGTHRVDFLSPAGLRTWGDGRLMITGTEGTLEARTNVDVGGRRGREHLLLVDGHQARRLDVGAARSDWAARLVADVRDGSDTFVAQDHVLAVSRLTLEAQAQAGAWPAPTDGLGA